MSIDGYMVLGSAIVGLLVGMTGAGGGALMTPMLIFMFGVTPSTAISSDLVAAVVMRPVGAAVHLRRGTVNLRLVGWLALGSVPAALLGALLLKALGTGPDAETRIEIVLGTALLLGAASMALRTVTRRGHGGLLPATELELRPVPTVLVGLLGGLMVGLTSVGSGSLMIVLLLFLYPMVSASSLVGTDLVQAIPLTAAAAVGQLLFGHIEFAVTLSVIIGSVPAVLVGSLLSSRAPDKLLRPVIFFVLLASGLKYVGVGTTALACIMGAVLAASGAGWLVVRRRRAARVASA
ncbi:MAG TPA: sulfite exporter TauE/SafE family protein [Acidimicrobiales bacterium]|nr:sulfite exporter TauE/SafE family protein [Acidimicrobiales bacterium]